MYYLLGFVYDELENYQKAIMSYSRALSINPNHYGAYNNRSIVYYKTGQYNEAIDDLTQCIINAPDANAYKGRAKNYQAIAEQTTNKKQKAEYLKKAEEDFAMMEKLDGSR